MRIKIEFDKEEMQKKFEKLQTSNKMKNLLEERGDEGKKFMSAPEMAKPIKKKKKPRKRIPQISQGTRHHHNHPPCD